MLCDRLVLFVEVYVIVKMTETLCHAKKGNCSNNGWGETIGESG